MTKERTMVSNTSAPEQVRASPAAGARFILGVDGGGSKTAALVAVLEESGQLSILGRGKGGPSNLRLAGKTLSLASLFPSPPPSLTPNSTIHPTSPTQPAIQYIGNLVLSAME